MGHLCILHGALDIDDHYLPTPGLVVVSPCGYVPCSGEGYEFLYGATDMKLMCCLTGDGKNSKLAHFS